MGSRLTAEILYRMGLKVKYLGDFYTTTDSKIDVTLRGCGYDVPDCHIKSYPLVDDLRELKRQMRCSDVVVAHKNVELIYKACYDLGIPFMPNFVTFFLPDSISLFEVDLPRIDYDTISYTMTCALQSREVIKLLEGKEVVFAPDAILVLNGEIRKVRLSPKRGLP